MDTFLKNHQFPKLATYKRRNRKYEMSYIYLEIEYIIKNFPTEKTLAQMAVLVNSITHIRNK